MAGGSVLVRKYDNFHNPVAEVWADGQEIKTKEGIYLERVEVTSSVGREPDMAVLVYRADKAPEGTPDGLEKYFILGQKLEIKAGYGDKLARVFLGYLHEVQVHDRMREYVEYTLIGLDVKGLMKKNSIFAASGTAKAQQMLKDILGEAGYSALMEKKSVDALPSGMNQDCVIRGETHYDWLCGLADYLDYEFYCGRGTLVFGKAGTAKGAPMELTEEYGLRSLDLTASMAGQTGSIQVCGHNRKDEMITGNAKWEGVQSPFGKKLKRTLQNFGMRLWDMGLETGEQAKYRAQAAMDRAVAEYVCMEAVCVGFPELEPGIQVKLTDKKVTSLSGTVYVKEVRHLLDKNGYKCSLKGSKCGE